MYDATPIEVYVSSSGYCFDEAEDLTLMCQMTGAWIGNEPDPEEFIRIHAYMYVFM